MNFFITYNALYRIYSSLSTLFAEKIHKTPNKWERKVFVMLMERINDLTKEKGWSRRELERKAGLSFGSISKWVKFNPTQQNLKKVADTLGVSVAYLTGESEFRSEQEAVIDKWNRQMKTGLSDEVKRIEAGIRIPVLGEVPCGIPIEAIEIIGDEWEEISERMARTGCHFGLYAKGDSMKPRICEGDVLIVRQQNDCVSGDVVIVKVNGNEACCKRLIKHDDGIVLQSFNPSYPPIFFNKEEIAKIPVQIIGKVVENRQKF